MEQPLEVTFPASGKSLHGAGAPLVPEADTAAPPVVHWPQELPNSLYTLVMYDVDAPYPAPQNANAPFLHWLVQNIRDNDIDAGQTALPYLAPRPPLDSPPHRYIIDVLVQFSGRVGVPMNVPRERFPLGPWARANDLLLIGTNSFRVAPPEAAAAAPVAPKAKRAPKAPKRKRAPLYTQGPFGPSGGRGGAAPYLFPAGPAPPPPPRNLPPPPPPPPRLFAPPLSYGPMLMAPPLPPPRASVGKRAIALPPLFPAAAALPTSVASTVFIPDFTYGTLSPDEIIAASNLPPAPAGVVEGGAGLMLPGFEQRGLTAQQASACRCIAHVGRRQPVQCLRSRRGYHQVGGRECYNPYAVCVSSTGSAYPGGLCAPNLNFEAMADPELLAWALLHGPSGRGLPVPNPYDRRALLQSVAQYICPGTPTQPLCEAVGYRPPSDAPVVE